MNDEFDSKKIIDKYADMIYRIALGRLDNKEEAEDIVQEVFILYINHIKQYDFFKDNEYEKCWLIRVTINLCYNDNKSARVQKTVPLEKCNFLEARNLEDKSITECLSKLKDKYRVVFELFYIDDLKISEISKILKISQSNVKTRLKRARDMLRKKLQLGGEFSGRI